MSIAVTEDHRALAQTVADFLAKHQARAIARGLLESDEEPLPGFWAEMARLGLLGLHVPRSTAAPASACPSCWSWSSSWAAPWLPARSSRP